MQGHATSLAVRPDLAAAVTAGDAGALRAIAVAALTALREVDPVVRVVEVTDATGRVLIRGHNPAQSGDNKANIPDVAAALRGSPGLGLTLSPTSGELAAGAVVPLRAEGRIIGTVKVAARLDAATAAELGRAGGAQVLLFGGTRLIASTLRAGGEVPPGLPEGAEPQRVALAEAGPHRAVSRPLVGLDGRPAGRIVVALPMAAQDAARLNAELTGLGVAFAILIGSLAAGLVAARRLARPLSGLATAMGAIAAGQLRTEVKGAERTDEIGAMARALEAFRADAEKKAALERETAAERSLRERRQAELQRLTREFGAALSGVMRGLSSASESMAGTASTLGEVAQRTEQRSLDTSEVSRSAVQDLGTVAAATEELTASVGEIARQASGAASAARGMGTRAVEADRTMAQLADAAAQIGQVAQLIAQIAAQTNLLALNATIEAARAGEAGKGFAVVAGEVKSLAAQTAKATEEIAARIQTIQGTTDHAVSAVRGMGEEVRRMEDSAAAIAAAVEEQGAATREISGNVSLVLNGLERALQAMDDAVASARASREAGDSVQGAAGGVSRETETLGREVELFLAALDREPEDRRRAVRLPVQNRSAKLRLGERVMAVRLLDLSESGVGIEAGGEAAGLEPGLPVQVMIEGGGALSGRIARIEGGRIGVVLRQDDENRRVIAGLAGEAMLREAA
jgi:methyl-accepting chemotaxis protein